jgi:leucyl-tRNA synthetase
VIEKNGKYYLASSGQELISQIDKMSKSKLNGVTPDDIVEEFGADALRLYEMFMGPFDKEKIWNTDAVNGCRRFLNRFYDLCVSEKVSDDITEEALKLGHRLVKQVTEDIDNMQFNTAIAHMMEFVNAMIKLDSYPKKVLQMALQMLNPFAPHLAEEIWEIFGNKEILAFAALPKVDPKYLVDDEVTIVVQINGKLRAQFRMKKDVSKEEALKRAYAEPKLENYLKGTIVKEIFVPNKLINLVVRPT